MSAVKSDETQILTEPGRELQKVDAGRSAFFRILIVEIDEGFIFQKAFRFEASGFLLGFFYSEGAFRRSLLGGKFGFRAFFAAFGLGVLILQIGYFT